MSIFKSRAAAYTLVEVMITVAVIGVAGAGIFEVLRTGMILFGKNSAINLSHTESRFGLVSLQQDLNAAVSTPELTGTGVPVLNGAGVSTILSGTLVSGSAAGVYFQEYAGGPFCIYVTTLTIASSATSIPVITGSNFAPLPGQTIHIQALPLTLSSNSMLEAQLSGASPYSASTTSTGGMTYYTPTLSSSIGATVTLQDSTTNTNLNVACFFTTPVVYVVQNGQLVKYTLDPAGSGNMLPSVLAYNVTSATPFSMPAVNYSPANTFVNVSNMTATDPSSSNRGYHSVLTPFTTQFSHFSQLTVKY